MSHMDVFLTSCGAYVAGCGICVIGDNVRVGRMSRQLYGTDSRLDAARLDSCSWKDYDLGVVGLVSMIQYRARIGRGS